MAHVMKNAAWISDSLGLRNCSDLTFPRDSSQSEIAQKRKPVSRKILRGRRHGASLIELMTVLGVLSIVLSLTLPAITSVREIARRASCSNNCRQFAIGALHLESAKQKLPGSFLSQMPTGARYNSDEGAFVSLLPFLEQLTISNELDSNALTFDQANSRALASMPSVMSCPSGLPSATVKELAQWFSGPVSSQVEVDVADYALCAGVSPSHRGSFRHSEGVSRLHIPGLTTPRQVAHIVDGLSNSIGGWESRGDSLVLADGRRFAFDTNAPSSKKFWAGENIAVDAIGTSTTKAWSYSWAGFASGAVSRFLTSGMILDRESPHTTSSCINVTNIDRGPISLHAGGVNIWFVDGSTKFLDESTTPSVILQLATISGEHES